MYRNEARIEPDEDVEDGPVTEEPDNEACFSLSLFPLPLSLPPSFA